MAHGLSKKESGLSTVEPHPWMFIKLLGLPHNGLISLNSMLKTDSPIAQQLTTVYEIPVIGYDGESGVVAMP